MPLSCAAQLRMKTYAEQVALLQGEEVSSTPELLLVHLYLHLCAWVS